MRPQTLLEEQRRLQYAALEHGLRALFDLAVEACDAEALHEGGWAGLPPDAAAQFVIGLHTLVADLHRGGIMVRPWPEDDVVEVLVGRVMPLLAPTTFTRTATGALVTLERPAHVEPGRAWERAAVSTLALLAKAVHAGVDVRAYLPDTASPDAGRRVLADLRFAPA